jgi:L-threonylcarbamoyladenylate synthase
MYLDGGATAIGIESTVVLAMPHGVKILRHGAITAQQLAEVVTVLSDDISVDPDMLPAPGMLQSHYAPNKPLYVFNTAIPDALPPQSGVIVNCQHDVRHVNRGKCVALSVDGDLAEMAVNLFAVMHQLEDDVDIRQIYIQTVPPIGVGLAIMDRIRKAAFNYQQ